MSLTQESAMSYSTEGYYGDTVAEAPVSARRAFIQRTYLHLAGAILAFVGLEALILQVPALRNATLSLFTGGMFGMLIILAAFIGVSYLARSWARSATSKGTQYAGLLLFIVFEAIIFAPLLFVATSVPKFAEQHLVEKAALMTLAVFAGLTTAVFVTKRDFSFMGPALCVGGWLLLAVIVGAIIFGSGGIVTLLICFAGIALASGFIIYDTSNVIHHFNTNQHVAAALDLFASVALLFWYILRIFMISRDE
jgi:FtsH-binding integral membrane protein